jgi:hypothetical protein
LEASLTTTTRRHPEFQSDNPGVPKILTTRGKQELEKFHEIFEKFEDLELLNLAKEFLKESGQNFNLNYETEKLDYEIINFTNRFTGTPKNYAKIVLKNPKYFYEKFLDILKESQEKQVEIILKILEETRGIS